MFHVSSRYISPHHPYIVIGAISTYLIVTPSGSFTLVTVDSILIGIVWFNQSSETEILPFKKIILSAGSHL